ncbi:hypothetical protein KIK15_02455 [Williamsia sp. CHRR-6]|nr:hypothetical protein [Williamsia sp. CHRR-6]
MVGSAALVALSVPFAGSACAAPAPLNGLFSIDAGVCSGAAVTGSFFRMILPAGTTSGPFLANSDSTCSDKTVTPLAGGSSGGLSSGSFQPQPAQPFDGSGNAVAGSVTRPVKFYGVGFATSTNSTDPQTGQAAASPQLRVDGTTITGDLSSFGVTWNRQVFNQGAPKPGGGLPGKTTPVRGTINRATGAYVIEWTSQIVGGPFNNFTGLWHLSGTYRGSGLGAAPAAPAAPAPNAPAPNAPAREASAPNAPAPNAPAREASAPNAAGPANAAAAQSNATTSDPRLAAQTIEVTDDHPRWLLPVLVAVTAIATALLTNADRLVRRRRSE